MVPSLPIAADDRIVSVAEAGTISVRLAELELGAQGERARQGNAQRIFYALKIPGPTDEFPAGVRQGGNCTSAPGGYTPLPLGAMG